MVYKLLTWQPTLISLTTDYNRSGENAGDKTCHYHMYYDDWLRLLRIYGYGENLARVNEMTF